MTTSIARVAGHGACDFPEVYKPRFPFKTLKCVGPALYRSHSARNYACLLDLDQNVTCWRCCPSFGDHNSDRKFTIDFLVETSDEPLIVEIWEHDPGDTWRVAEAARRCGYGYRAVCMPEIRKHPRLQNAKDLIRYAGYDAPLGDRIRLSVALGEFGSLTLAECLAALRDGPAMQTMATLILQGEVEVDLDNTLLGPDTIIRLASR